jgi:acyl-coenzyme A synthetase/AMP-(fatty) acid ligase
LPLLPEQVIAMLACAKIGAVHSVVYGGFSVEALAERIEDAQSRVLITADGGWLRGKIVSLSSRGIRSIPTSYCARVLPAMTNWSKRYASTWPTKWGRSPSRRASPLSIACQKREVARSCDACL